MPYDADPRWGRIVHVVKVRFTGTQLYTLDHLVSKLRVARRGRKAGYAIRLVLIYCEESVMAMRERRRNLDADELIERQRGVIEQVTIPLGETADAACRPGRWSETGCERHGDVDSLRHLRVGLLEHDAARRRRSGSGPGAPTQSVVPPLSTPSRWSSSRISTRWIAVNAGHETPSIRA